MALVTTVGLLLGGESIRRRGEAWRARAAYHAARARELGTHLPGQRDRQGGTTGDRGRTEADRLSRLAWYHRDLWRKYDRAASAPWLPVAPDPPEPG